MFNWNGTTSGVCIPNSRWISNDRKGLTICDATSAAFAMEIDWTKDRYSNTLLAKMSRWRSSSWNDNFVSKSH